MESNKIQNIIIKYLSHQATFSELNDLEKWVQNPNNEKLFNSYIRTNYAIDYNMKKFNSEKIKIELLKEIANERKVFKLKKRYQVMRYAAAMVIVGLLATTYFFGDDLFNKTIETKTIIVNTNTILPGTDKATLTLEDGSQISLEKGTSVQTQNASSNGEKIIYEAEKPKTNEIAYNYLTIPRGGQFFIKLSDGTQVWLNSESQLKYPVSFIEGKARTVELVYGEAYFVVSPSTEHKGSKFKVFNKSQEVEVIGTEFNIKAYKDENNIYTTLVEGKVDISIENRKQNLIPNQQLNLDLKTNVSTIKEIDVFNEISWKDGVFSFEEKSLKDIMTVLSRWYDIEVVFKNKSIEKEEFIGILRKNQNIEEILNGIKNFGVIKNFTINDEKVILE